MSNRFEIFNKFQKYHKENPGIFDEYRILADDLYLAGRRHYSSDALIHVLRFRNDIQTNSRDFKISNDYTAYYARMLMAVDYKFKEFFTIKYSDDSDLNYLSRDDFWKIYCGKEVKKDLQQSLF